MHPKTNPEAVILGALFDFSGHLRTTSADDPFQAVDSFARLRKLTATEVPTMTWRELLDTLRDPTQELPSDSELVKDLLILAEAFKDADPGADNRVFDLINNAALRVRRLDAQRAPVTPHDKQKAIDEFADELAGYQGGEDPKDKHYALARYLHDQGYHKRVAP